MSVSCDCCVLKMYRSLRRADHSPREEIPPSAVRVLAVRNLMAHGDAREGKLRGKM